MTRKEALKMRYAIIKLEMEDGSFEYLHQDIPDFAFIKDESQALRMDFAKALRISLTMGTIGMRHSIITKREWQ